MSILRHAAFGLAVLATPIVPVFATVPTQTTEPAAILSAAELRADLDTWLEWTRDTHPDLAHSVEPGALEAAASALADDLPETVTRAEAWRRLATLNPLLNDAHMGLVVPEPPALPDGTATMTIAIEDGALRVVEGADILPDGSVIGAVNGRTWAELLGTLRPLVRGESDRLREHIIELRLRHYLALALDGEPIDRLDYVAPDGTAGQVVIETPIGFSTTETGDFALSWRDSAAILSVPSFDRDREEEFAVFLADAFAEIAARGADHLVIDLRTNGGGAHDLSDRLMAYLTDRPYSAISAVTARITAENQALIPGSTIGQIVSVPFQQTVSPPEDMENRYSGPVTIMIGPATYSQAIVFAATARDHEVARLTGQPTAGPANQTGQVQSHRLPHSGFTVRAPLYVLYRASGDPSRAPLMPDIVIPADADDPIGAVLAVPE
ncbi:S41 family peptidase [Parasphingopyxis sp.]|uniref:S41 family peptidase n=1 Tax=Parasphingopyxis sp. TaxID=1920299 RepID=UPI0026146746|nr:S41 family peptidase [Parasphingopyxis sp.]